MRLLGPRGRQRRAELEWTQHDAGHAGGAPALFCPPPPCGVHPERKAVSCVPPGVRAARAVSPSERGTGENSGARGVPSRAGLRSSLPSPQSMSSAFLAAPAHGHLVAVAWPLAPSRPSQLANETSSRAAKRPARSAGRGRLIICRILKISMPTSWSAGLTSIQRAVIFPEPAGSLWGSRPPGGLALPSSRLPSTAGFSKPRRMLRFVQW